MLKKPVSFSHAWRPQASALAYAVCLSALFSWSANTQANEKAEWPKGHYPLPDEGNVVGKNYTVTSRAKDTLLDIAREHNVGYNEIRRANPDVSLWVPGEGTEVVIPARHILPPGPREGLVINVAELRLYYYPPVEKGETSRVETYPIGIGRAGYDTPLGVTKTTMRLENPAWYPPHSMREEAAARGEPAPAVVPPGPDNPLGDYAILLDIPGYLIHGTNRPDGIGMRASRGCIRMYPEDIEAIFGRIADKTQVNIVEQPVKIGWDGEQAYAQAFQALDEQEQGMSSLLEALAQLDSIAETPPVDYQELRLMMEAPNGQVIALSPYAPSPEEEDAETTQPGGLYRYLAV